MKPELLSASDEELLRKRVIIESVIKELKTQTQLEHSRHRNIVNFQVNVYSALIAYQLLENKPSVKANLLVNSVFRILARHIQWQNTPASIKRRLLKHSGKHGCGYKTKDLFFFRIIKRQLGAFKNATTYLRTPFRGKALKSDTSIKER